MAATLTNMSTESTRLEFSSGVARFDAMGNLFVHLPHSVDAPMPVVLGDGRGAEAPARERRVFVKGRATEASARGTFATTADLPRGALVVTVQGYDSAVLREDGTLEVEVAEPGELPSWFQAGERHLFRREGEALRLWARSALPEGIALTGTNAASPPLGAGPEPSVPKTTAAPPPQPGTRRAPIARKAPPPAFRPEEARRADGTSRLAGCTGLLVLGAIGLALTALLAG